ncbi:MAG: transposase [Mycobacterium sp.]
MPDGGMYANRYANQIRYASIRPRSPTFISAHCQLASCPRWLIEQPVGHAGNADESQLACSLRITAAIPEPADQQAHRKRRGPRGGRPPAFGAADYKGRNVIERGFNTVKQWRGLATRYDKLAVVYRGAAVLRAITIWLPHLSDTP